MSKVAVVFWSGTGNTQMMADAVEAGAKDKGAEVVKMGPGEFSADKVAAYDAIAFGSPAMGAEVLEEGEVEPMFTAVEGSLSGKRIGLFGSYDWGDGQWMRDWVARMQKAGATVLGGEGIICQEAPEADVLAKLEQAGKDLAALA